MLVNETSHKFTGKLGQKVDKSKCGHNYKIILVKVYFISLTKAENHSALNIIILSHQKTIIGIPSGHLLFTLYEV